MPSLLSSTPTASAILLVNNIFRFKEINLEKKIGKDLQEKKEKKVLMEVAKRRVGEGKDHSISSPFVAHSWQGGNRKDNKKKVQWLFYSLFCSKQQLGFP